MAEKEEFLLKKIADLEKQLTERNNELSLYKAEIQSTNTHLKKLITKMQGELSSLHKLQKKLIPTEFPTIPGFNFSSKFTSGEKNGGDYFDIISHKNKSKFGVLIASCSSYIVSALLMVTVLRNVHKIELNKDADPGAVASGIIDSIQEDLEEGHSLDLFYGTFDRKKFEFNYISLGDVFAVHQSFATGELQILNSDISVVNKTNHFDLKANCVHLKEKDRLLFFTKGVQLVEGLNGEHYGKERIMQAILNTPKEGAHKVRNFIYHELMKYNIHDKLQRDTTIVVAEVKDRVIKLA